jgi:hypothetical protein
LLAIFKYSDAAYDSTRALIYRIAFAFSPIQFSGTLLFIYAVKLLFEDAQVQISDSKSKEESQKQSETPQLLHFTSPLDDDDDLVFPCSLSPESELRSTP